jgi:hypothetical protein
VCDGEDEPDAEDEGHVRGHERNEQKPDPPGEEPVARRERDAEQQLDAELVDVGDQVGRDQRLARHGRIEEHGPVRVEERHQVARRRQEEPDGDDPDQQVERVGGDPAPEVRAEHDPQHAQRHGRREETPEGAEDRVVIAQLQVGRRELAEEIRVGGREQARCSLAQPAAEHDRVVFSYSSV